MQSFSSFFTNNICIYDLLCVPLQRFYGIKLHVFVSEKVITNILNSKKIMIKRTIFVLLQAFLMLSCTQKDEVSNTDLFIGEYVHSGTAVNNYNVTKNGVSKKEVTNSSFSNSSISIYKEVNGDRLVVSSTRYGTSYGDVKNGVLYIDERKGSMYDDGSIIQAGSLLNYTYIHDACKIVDGTLEWQTTSLITSYNTSNGALLTIVSTIQNKAVKKK